MSEEKENKYFTPDIEDIRVGYKCEWRNSNEEDIWRTTMISNSEDLYHIINSIQQNLDTKYRTLYLTKEQIEAEGWKESEVDKLLHKDRYKTQFAIVYTDDKKYIFLHIVHENQSEKDLKAPQYFAGRCNDINAFRYITKLLNIN